MLVEFCTRNYRSFRDENTLSMVASGDKTLRETNVHTSRNQSVPGLLRSAVIYGANASGKSNLVRAITVMRAIVLQSAALQPGSAFNVQPFALDPVLKLEPSEFEVTFVREKIRYQYGFTLTPVRIVSEWLIVYKTSQPQNWFTRELNRDTGDEEYKFSAHFQGQRKLWQSSTRPNALFLSTAIQLNSEQLKPVFDWFQHGLTIAENGGLPTVGNIHPLEYTLGRLQESDVLTKAATDFLSGADTGISQIKIDKEKQLQQALSIDAAGKVDFTRQEKEVPVARFIHSTANGSAQFAFVDESEGTQRLFTMAGPLFEILRTGSVLLVDELDRSLHALLVRRIVEMFQTPALNQLGAQLVFTTHDTSLLSADLLRRDQIWLVEKDRGQASHVYPLTDFAPRKKEALERGYLSGRYGGIPVLKRDGSLLDVEKL